ncbi:MAG TPA: hypothetical protein VLG92_01180 [Candidatus Saccharimonadia bacterium]|nr:hypothetical protein [Candidatus Saccharimonadia bacterium]
MSIKELFPKKVKISDVVSPTPSRAASKVLDVAMKRANNHQKAVSSSATITLSVLTSSVRQTNQQIIKYNSFLF